VAVLVTRDGRVGLGGFPGADGVGGRFIRAIPVREFQRGFQGAARLLRGIGAGVDAVSGVCPGRGLGGGIGYLHA
ncbi:hypothetical protein HW114_15495, partial [Serratia symbiotica]|nr:hypothetical protein [Serratia symbiotica]